MREITISLSKSLSPEGHDHPVFNEARGQFPNLASVITKRVWSPIVWKGGKRNTSNFSHADLLVLDFDTGVTLEQGKAILDDYNLTGMIGTTRSHQTEKNGVTEDRFRMLLLMASTCSDLEQYTQNVAKLSSDLGADRKCKDGARLFFPCREIVHVTSGVCLSWADKRPRENSNINYETYRRTGTVPSYVSRWLTSAKEGERHSLCYKVAAEMTKCGFSEKEIYKAIMSSKIRGLGDAEIIRTIAGARDGAAHECR